MAWSDHYDEFRKLVGREQEIRANRSGTDELSDVCQAQQRVISRAAAELPAKGPDVDWVIGALGEEGERYSFAFAVLRRRRQFPKRYLEPLVRAAARHGTRGAGEIEAARRAYGRADTMRLLLQVAEDGGLTEHAADMLLYMARMKVESDPGGDEDTNDLERQIRFTVKAGT